MSAKKQLAEAVALIPEGASFEEAFARLYQAFWEQVRRERLASRPAGQQVSLRDAATQLGPLIQTAQQQGTELIITQDQTPIAKLIPLSPDNRRRRLPGSARGLLAVPADFNAPLADFDEYQ